MSFTLDDLNQIIAARVAADPQESYSAQLLNKGVAHCAQKLGEEAVETVIAATLSDKSEVTKEAADVLYHLLVLLRATDVSLGDVMSELKRRTDRSGIEEKASR
ncbi:MAG TPA: phosphoribosyl-ATP diphosphatase [Devosia sp.]|nr:phosphoribosyl-ATP diphosphatase [Devosia sp.]